MPTEEKPKKPAEEEKKNFLLRDGDVGMFYHIKIVLKTRSNSPTR